MHRRPNKPPCPRDGDHRVMRMRLGVSDKDIWVCIACAEPVGEAGPHTEADWEPMTIGLDETD